MINLIITVALFIFYDIVMYYRIQRLERKIADLATNLFNITQQLDKKIEDHKLETRRIA